MSNLITITDRLSGTLLYQTSIEKVEEAYSFATMLEKEGADIILYIPPLSFGQEINNQDDFGCVICPPPIV